MSLIGLIMTLVIIGVLLWLLNTYVPMDPKIKNILNVLVVIVVILWLLQAFGVLGSLQSVRISMASAQTVAPIAFEDVNNNGTWEDGTDKDITQVIMTQREFATPNGVVITAVLKPPDPQLKQTGVGGCAYIRAGKNITIRGAVLCPYYDGTVILWSDGAINFGDGVILTGRNRVTLAALGDITLGNKVTMTSSGGSANQGALAISGHGKVTIGSTFTATALKDFSIDGRGGTLTMGAGAKITSTKASVRLTATGDISIDGAILKGVDIDITSFTGAVSYRNGTATVPKTGTIGVFSYLKTVDVSGTRFVGPVATWPVAAAKTKVAGK